MFVYGGGVNVPALSRVDVRIEVRDLAYKTPDFGVSALQTNAFTFVYEPALGVAYRFRLGGAHLNSGVQVCAPIMNFNSD
jgi:hypothetical protein